MSGAQHVLSAAIGAAAALAATLLVGATRQPPRAAVLDVERINIREPDGTLRMVLSGAAREPGIVVDGHEQPHLNRRSAGILFYNDEGTENGGLIFDGRRDAAGQPHSSGSLTFDRYRQDQLVQLQATEDGGQRHGGLIVNDHPDAPIDYPAVARALTLPPPEQPAAFRAANVATTRRVFVGRTAAGASELQLKDATGASRLVLTVDPAGQAAILFLDALGGVQRRIAMR